MAHLIRLTARSTIPSFSRSFSLSAVSRKDLIQDLYVSQLKNYKPSAQAQDAHAGSVRSYTPPSPPKAPVLPTDLASELSKFDAEEPTLASPTTSAKATSSEEGGEGAAEFLSFLEQDLPKEEAHH